MAANNVLLNALLLNLANQAKRQPSQTNTAPVGTQVNVVNSSHVSAQTRDTTSSSSHSAIPSFHQDSTASSVVTQDYKITLPIKVFNQDKKRESKTFMLHHLEDIKNNELGIHERKVY